MCVFYDLASYDPQLLECEGRLEEYSFAIICSDRYIIIFEVLPVSYIMIH